MSKGRILSKKKWRDFRKSNKYIIDTKGMSPRNSKFIERFEGSHISNSRYWRFFRIYYCKYYYK